MRTAADWAAMRRGVSRRRDTVIVKVAPIEGEHTVIGFVVSKKVGGAVVRNTVKRRLRAILGGMLGGLPPGRGIVVRALPHSARVQYGDLEKDVRKALGEALGGSPS